MDTDKTFTRDEVWEAFKPLRDLVQSHVYPFATDGNDERIPITAAMMRIDRFLEATGLEEHTIRNQLANY